MTLLDTAKQMPRKRKVSRVDSDEALELSFAYYCGHIGVTQVAYALGLKNKAGAASSASTVMRNAIRIGKVTISKVEP